MYVLIVIGLLLLVVPTEILDQYAPEFIKKVDFTTRMVMGGVCLGGAYYMYTLSSPKSVSMEVNSSDISSKY
jgi:hypothetical protein